MNTDLQDRPASDPRRRLNWKHFLKAQARRTGLVVLGVLFAILGFFLYNSVLPSPIPLTQNEIDEIVERAIASATPEPAYSTQVYQVIFPSLVYIRTRNLNFNDLAGIGVGSGVVINDNGDILTAYHVIADAGAIEIVFSDGTHAQAEVLATEPENDIAVLHPSQPPEIIVPAVLGNPSMMQVGDQTFAVGNPLGLAGSLSAGVISGFDRSLPMNERGQRLEGLIQFDAAVNPGNSGGPLLNRAGQVIGIVTALANPNEQDSFTGIGFAVPITTAGGAAGAPRY
jgi:S1-C subfamily serine protease